MASKAKEQQIQQRKAQAAHKRALREQADHGRHHQPPAQVIRPGGPTPVVEVISPARAAMYLENVAPNRKVQPARVEQYARDLAHKRWSLNGETIKFSADGQLLDGQHRLRAAVQADKPITTYVVRGLESEAFSTIDVGMKRTAGQIMGMAGHGDGLRLSAALSWLHRYRNNTMRRIGGSGAATVEELFALLGKEPGIKESLGWAVKMRKLKYGSLWVLIHYLLAKQDATMADLFMDALATGLNAKPGDPTYVLRERLIDNASRRARMSPPDVYAVTIRAWNAVRSGTVIRKVQVPRRDADFDMPDPA